MNKIYKATITGTGGQKAQARFKVSERYHAWSDQFMDLEVYVAVAGVRFSPRLGFYIPNSGFGGPICVPRYSATGRSLGQKLTPKQCYDAAMPFGERTWREFFLGGEVTSRDLFNLAGPSWGEGDQNEEGNLNQLVQAPRGFEEFEFTLFRDKMSARGVVNSLLK